MSPSISIVIPCWKRIDGTRSIINNLLNQTVNNWEALIVGDGCEEFQALIDSGELEHFKQRAEKLHNKFIYFNLPEHKGGWGYACQNEAIKIASGTYFTFAANDDYIAPNHLEVYLKGIQNLSEDYGIVGYASYLKAYNKLRIRYPSYRREYIGHSEIICRTECVKQAGQHDPAYGHDWALIKDIVEIQNKKILLYHDNPPTYTAYIRGGIE